MNTSKPISTISFNTEDFLHWTLNDLVDSGIISFYVYIKHNAEPIENGDDTLKDHFHVYAEPSKRIQTEDLRKKFIENDPNNPKPLRVLTFKYSKFADWYLYGLHDPMYLASKGMTRSYYYSKEDMITNSEDDLIYRVNNINTDRSNYYYEMNEYQNKGYTFMQYSIMKNLNPMQYKAYSLVWSELENEKCKTYRKKEKEASAGEQHLLKDKTNIIQFRTTSISNNII